MGAKIENVLLTPEQVAKKLGVRKSTIYQWSHRGYIPHIKMGRFIRFKESTIDNWLDKNAVKGRVTRRVRIDV